MLPMARKKLTLCYIKQQAPQDKIHQYNNGNQLSDEMTKPIGKHPHQY